MALSRSLLASLVVLLGASLVGCETPPPLLPDAPTDGGPFDGGGVDGGGVNDGGVDAGQLDGGALDSGGLDGGGLDGGALDSGGLDGGALDSGGLDGGALDGGGLDGGGLDAGAIDGGAAVSTGHVRGRVLESLTFDTVAIPGVVLTASNGVTVTSAADGSFDLTGLPVGSRISIHVEPPRGAVVYSSTELLVDVTASEDARIDARLLRGCSSVVDLAGGVRSRPLSPCGSRGALVGVELPLGGVVDASGAPVARVRMEIAAIPALAGELVGEAFLAFPGDMVALDASGAEVWLESRGAAEVRLFDDVTGESAALAPGRVATLIVPAAPSSIEDEAPRIWSYDPDARAWIEEGSAVLEVDPASGMLLTRMTVPHFTWWNSDQPASRTCLSGRIEAVGGVPIGAATLTTRGVDYAGSSFASSAADGTFQVFARAASIVDLVIQSAAGMNTLETSRIATGAVGTCIDVGVITVDTTRALGCSRGLVEDALGAPLASADVTATQLGRTVATRTGSDGSFCLPLIGGVSAVVRAESTDMSGAPLHGQLYEVQVPAGNSCGGPSCTDLGSIVVRASSCITGTISDLSGPASGASLLLDGRPGSGRARSAADGTFCAPVPAGDVYAAYGFFRDAGGASSAEVRTVVVPASAGSCGSPATCARVDLVARELTCLRGIAVDGLGAPIAGATVRARPEGSTRVASALTGADGSFCVAARVGERSSVEILRETRTQRDYTAFSITAGTTVATCGGSGCSDAGTRSLVRSTFATCIRGRLLDGGAPIRVPIEVLGLDQVAILRPREDGRFCVEADPGPPGTLTLTDPNTVGCARDRATSVPAPPTAASSCIDEDACTDVGDLDFADFCAAS